MMPECFGKSVYKRPFNRQHLNYYTSRLHLSITYVCAASGSSQAKIKAMNYIEVFKIDGHSKV